MYANPVFHFFGKNRFEETKRGKMAKSHKNRENNARKQEYERIFRAVDEDERGLVSRLIDECVWYEGQMADLRKYPFLAVHPKRPELQRTTPAARLYKEYATSYMNALRILLNVLRKVESSAQDDLLKRLEEFV